MKLCRNGIGPLAFARARNESWYRRDRTSRSGSIAHPQCPPLQFNLNPLVLLRLLWLGRLGYLERLARLSPDGGPIRIGLKRGWMVNTAELIEEVLVTRPDEFVKSPALRIYSRPLLGNGLLTNEGASHMRQRRLVAPAFAHQRVSRYAEVMSRFARDTFANWPDNAVIPSHREMTRLTLGIVGRTLFDADLLSDADEIGKNITELIHFATRQARSLRPTQTETENRRNRSALAAVERLNRAIYGMIEQRRAMNIDKGDLMSMLLLARDEDGNALSNEQVRDEAMTLFVAGHETTANASVWSLYLLAHHPEIQRDLQQQVAATVGSRPIAIEDLPRLPLAMQVFKESMRLFPPAYIVVREALHDLQLSNGLHVRQGDLLALCEYTMHRNPRYFPDPLRFDPTRFSPENEPRINRYAYFPFGAGKRICIGNQFALMEGQIILATAMQHVTVSPASSRRLRGDPLLTLRPKGEAKLRVTRVR